MGGIDLGRLRGDGDGFGDEAFDIVAGAGFTWIVASRNTSERQPCEASATNKRRARGQTGEKSHDRDDDDQRATSD